MMDQKVSGAHRSSSDRATRPVVGFEAYYSVSEDGTVYSHRTGRQMKPYLMKGYPTVGLKVAGGRQQKRVHRIVAEAFLGKAPPERPSCAHLDGNPLNNSISNLVWANQSENEAHKRLHGRARSPARKLSNKQVAIIRTAANRRLTRYELAVLAGVGEDAIYNILNGSHYND